MAAATGRLSLRKRTGETIERDLPIITKIETTLSASLTEMETIIYGYRNRFAMDLGNTQRYDLTIERVNPFSYNDNQDHDPSQWSNGRWYAELESMLDEWQTLLRDPFSDDDTIVGCFHLAIESGDPELYPDISKDVVLSGTMSASRTVQKLRVNLPLVVSRLNGGTTAPRESVDITFHPGEGTEGEAFTETYTEGLNVVMPNPPSSWTRADGAAFMHWVADDGTTATAGSSLSWYDGFPLSWTAAWKLPISCYIKDTAGTETLAVPTGAVSMTVHAVGGGGGAGSGEDTPAGAQRVYSHAGGAGASGAYDTTSRDNISPGEIITVTVGAGGVSRRTYQLSALDGDDGGSTSVSYRSVQILSVRGGNGGKGYDSDAGGVGGTGSVSGNAVSYAGGSTTTDVTVGGSDGETTNGIAGVGYDTISTRDGVAVTNYGQGGAGGGAADLNLTVTVQNGDVTETYGPFVSQGGDGGADLYGSSGHGERLPTTPLYGGGAGSMSQGSHSTTLGDYPPGADGIVIILFFD